MPNRLRLTRPGARRNTSASLRTVFSATLALLTVASSAAPGTVSSAAARPGPGVAAATRVPTAAAPDLIRGRQWALNALRIPRTWRYSRGAGVTVAVLDTGVDGNHPDLTGTVIPGPDFTGRTRSPGSKYWGRHGTAMASIIAGHGHGPQQESGILGVAPRTKILSVRVTLENEDPTRQDKAQLDRSRDAVAKGIRWAVENGAQVINMSLGGGTQFYDGSPAEEEAVKYALRQGAVLVASSGNDGEKQNRRTFPAAYPGIIAVGAVNRQLRVTRFSNHHDYVSVAAPGDDIVMADAGQGYVVGTGTSPSAAYVAGVAALVRSRYPQLTPEQVRQAIEQGVTHKPSNGRNDRVGAGVIDAIRAIFAARDINRSAYATNVPQTKQAAPLPDSAPRKTPNALVIMVLIVGSTVLLFGLVMLFWNLRRRSREAVPADVVEWTDDDWQEEDWPASEQALTPEQAIPATEARREKVIPLAAPTPPPPAPAPPPVDVAPVVSTDVYAGAAGPPDDEPAELPADPYSERPVAAYADLSADETDDEVVESDLTEDATDAALAEALAPFGHGGESGNGHHDGTGALDPAALRPFDSTADVAGAGGDPDYRQPATDFPGDESANRWLDDIRPAGRRSVNRRPASHRSTNGHDPSWHETNGNGNGANGRHRESNGHDHGANGHGNTAAHPEFTGGFPAYGSETTSSGLGDGIDATDSATPRTPLSNGAELPSRFGDAPARTSRNGGRRARHRARAKRSPRDPADPLDPLNPHNPIPQTDSSTSDDMSTPIADESWNSLRRSRKRMDAATSGPPSPLVPPPGPAAERPEQPESWGSASVTGPDPLSFAGPTPEPAPEATEPPATAGPSAEPPPGPYMTGPWPLPPQGGKEGDEPFPR